MRLPYCEQPGADRAQSARCQGRGRGRLRGRARRGDERDRRCAPFGRRCRHRHAGDERASVAGAADGRRANRAESGR
jgi:hypothetical protein